MTHTSHPDRQQPQRLTPGEPQVVGYVVGDALANIAALERDVRAYAASHHLGVVAAVYHDSAPTDGMLASGFDRCLAAIRMGPAHAVVVPHRADLAVDPSQRASLTAWVHAAGGVIHYVESEGAPS